MNQKVSCPYPIFVDAIRWQTTPKPNKRNLKQMSRNHATTWQRLKYSSFPKTRKVFRWPFFMQFKLTPHGVISFNEKCSALPQIVKNYIGKFGHCKLKPKSSAMWSQTQEMKREEVGMGFWNKHAALSKIFIAAPPPKKKKIKIKIKIPSSKNLQVAH